MSLIFYQVIVALIAAAVVLLGCAPHLLVGWIQAANQASGI